VTGARDRAAALCDQPALGGKAIVTASAALRATRRVRSSFTSLEFMLILSL
jgi:hypothetical protein